MSEPILPTHHCFDDALDYLVRRIHEDPALVDTKNIWLVHCLATMPAHQPDGGQLFAHAWVEEGESAWAAGILRGERIYYSVPAADLIRELQITDLTRYSPFQAWRLNRETGTYGPWKREYIALCRDKMRAGGAG